MKIPMTLSLLCCVLAASAQNITKVTTVLVTPTIVETNYEAATYYFNWRSSTNVVLIPFGEAARVSALKGDWSPYLLKEGSAFYVEKGDVVAGPVVFVTVIEAGSVNSPSTKTPALPATLYT